MPENQREDFAQDMWVLILGADLKCPPGSSLASFLNLTLFRARENWMARQRFRQQGQEEYEASPPDAEPATPADVTVEAQEALRELVASLTEASFTEDEIATVVEGLREGLTQKDIALSLGRTPQGLNYHFKKFRFAA